MSAVLLKTSVVIDHITCLARRRRLIISSLGRCPRLKMSSHFDAKDELDRRYNITEAATAPPNSA
jgi:hypothetical protein